MAIRPRARRATLVRPSTLHPDPNVAAVVDPEQLVRVSTQTPRASVRGPGLGGAGGLAVIGRLMTA